MGSCSCPGLAPTLLLLRSYPTPALLLPCSFPALSLLLLCSCPQNIAWGLILAKNNDRVLLPCYCTALARSWHAPDLTLACSCSFPTFAPALPYLRMAPAAALLLLCACPAPTLLLPCSCRSPAPSLLLPCSCSFPYSAPAYLLLPCSCQVPTLFLLLPCSCPALPCFCPSWSCSWSSPAFWAAAPVGDKVL